MYGFLALLLGLPALLQSSHQSSTACSAEKRERERPSNRISMRSLRVQQLRLVLRSVFISFRQEDILSTVPFKKSRLKHNSQRTMIFAHLVESAQIWKLYHTTE